MSVLQRRWGDKQNRLSCWDGVFVVFILMRFPFEWRWVVIIVLGGAGTGGKYEGAMYVY